MSKLLKKKMIGELKERFKDVDSCVVLEFKGLSVAQIDDLRNTLRSEDVSLTVVKDSLARAAFRELDLPDDENFFTGPTAIAYGGDDSITAPKVVSEWIKREKTQALEIKGGVFDKQAIDSSQVTELASIPPRPQMLSLVLSAIIAPAVAVLNLSQALQVKTARLTQALIDKKEEDTKTT